MGNFRGRRLRSRGPRLDRVVDLAPFAATKASAIAARSRAAISPADQWRNGNAQSLSVQHSRLRYFAALCHGTISVARHASDFGRISRGAREDIAFFRGRKVFARGFLESLRLDQVRALRR